MPEQVVISKEMILTHPHRNRGIFSSDAHKIRCNLCMPPLTNEQRYDPKIVANYKHHVLRIGSQAVRVTFRNKTVAYYGYECWVDPKNAVRVSNILSRELKPKIDLTQPNPIGI